MKLFYEKNGEEIEVGVGSVVDPGGNEASVMIKMRLVSDERQCRVGEQITFEPGDFNDIGWGCWAFASELSKKLPTP